MEWIIANIQTKSPGVEFVTAALMSCGITGVEIRDPLERARFFADSARTWDYADESLMVAESDIAEVVFYVTDDEAGAEILANVRTTLETLKGDALGQDLGSLAITLEGGNDQEWLNEWKKHFKPLAIGRVIVVPEWEDYIQTNPSDIIFNIDPGTAFGTGQHQTTQLCVHAIQKWVQPHDVVLDVGCGSGILSIVSVLLGADHVYAIDVDPAGAMAATKRNVELNPQAVGKITINHGDVLTDQALRETIGLGSYDVVVANIVADVIIPLAPIAAQFAKPGGLFVSSGIITERLNDVTAAFAAAGITVLEITEAEGWHSVVGRTNA